jgi:hypothetical protein
LNFDAVKPVEHNLDRTHIELARREISNITHTHSYKETKK